MSFASLRVFGPGRELRLPQKQLDSKGYACAWNLLLSLDFRKWQRGHQLVRDAGNKLPVCVSRSCGKLLPFRVIAELRPRLGPGFPGGIVDHIGQIRHASPKYGCAEEHRIDSYAAKDIDFSVIEHGYFFLVA